MCGHETPRPNGRDFITCTCGLRVSCGRAAVPSRQGTETVFGLLAVVAIVGATLDLLRRFW